MTSYGEGDSAQGRAQVGRAQVARAQVPGGRASVPGGAGHNGTAPGYNGGAGANGPAGRAAVGGARVGGAAGAAPVGRASVGRVGAPPVSPAGPIGPITPGGPGGPGGTRPGGPLGPGGKPSPAAIAKRRKKMRRRNWIIAAFAVFIIMAGGGVVAGTYYYDSVPPPQQLDLPEASTIYYTNGKDQIAKLGEENGGNREYVPIRAIPRAVQDAVISAEDRKFYSHDGIDAKGIMRAAWNNLTGGTTQGASTITQQYARHVADLTGITYARKLREAVMASKLNQEYSKEQILEFYLNTIYMGRGAYGIQAASRAYFNKTVDKLSAAEAAVLAAVIKQPEPSASHKGYDPAVNPTAAQERWNYVIDGMVNMGAIPEADRAKIKYPAVEKTAKGCIATATCGVDTPAGNVVNYVARELEAMGITDLKAGGYKITTTIDVKMQKAAEAAARRQVKGSPMAGQPKNLMAAIVAIEPETGRVKAYYGGEKGTGYDYAGLNVNEQTGAVTGTHAAGSTFKVYTLAAALKDGISTQSRWDALKLDAPGRDPLSNANRDDRGSVSCGRSCTLEESTVKSYNVPFYWITDEIGVGKVVEAAKAAGVRYMTPDDGVPVDLSKLSAENARGKFNTEVGFGQYGITVLDHATGIATFAAGGVYHPAHFVAKVEKKGEDGKYKLVAAAKEKGERRFDESQVNDLNAVLQKVPDANNDDLRGDRPATGKTGTWELDNPKYKGANSNAWMAGATPQLASAVWVGNAKNELPIVDKRGEKIGGSGLPAEVWKTFMDEALKGTDVQRFPPAARTGDDDRGNGTGRGNQSDENCILPLFCPDNNDGNGNDNDGNDGNRGPGNGNAGNRDDENDDDDPGGG